MAACVLCKEINELFLESLVELLIGRASLAIYRTVATPHMLQCAQLFLRLAPTACAYGSSPNGGDTARIVERSERKHAGTESRSDGPTDGRTLNR